MRDDLYHYYGSEGLMEDCRGELKKAAFEVLLNNPGIDMIDWQQILIEEYGKIVVDVPGNNPFDVPGELSDLWDDEYDDPATGIYMDFKEWALALSTEESIRMYYGLVETKRKNSMETECKELQDVTIEAIVSDIFVTLSVKKRRKDIEEFYVRKFAPDQQLFGENNPDNLTKDQVVKYIDTVIKEDQKRESDSYLKYNKGIYSKRPKKNPNINPTESLYTGKAGECAVMSELLFRGYNVNNMMVDEGIDLVASKANVYYYIQVKTSNVTEKNKIYFKIKSERFNTFIGTQMRYILVARYKKGKQDSNLYFIFNNNDMNRFVSQNKINESSELLNIKIEFDDRTGKAFLYDKNREDVSYFINNFDL